MFKKEEQYKDFDIILKEVNDYINNNFNNIVYLNDKDADVKIYNYISQYLLDNDLKVYNLSDEDLISKLFDELRGYSFLSKYLIDENVEEIAINAYNSIIVYYNNGTKKVLSEHFKNTEHQNNIINKLLQKSNKNIDISKPTNIGYLQNGERVTVIGYPITDKNIGTVLSLRRVNPLHLSKKDFIKNETLTEKMYDLLTSLIKSKISILFAGATSSGKTTILADLLKNVDDNNKIITMEQGTRELHLIKKDENNKVINNVIHLSTRLSNNVNVENVDLNRLLELALTKTPDILVIGEMKSYEAYAAQEASRTGHAVYSTIHSDNAKDTYSRIATLCVTKYDIDFNILYKLACQAFPIIVYHKKLKNNKRVISEILECVINDDNSISFFPLFKYKINSIVKDDFGNFKDYDGEFIQINDISDKLKEKLLESGIVWN